VTLPPVRIQKIIASTGIASRREAEEWIREGRVRVNGRVAGLGDRADPEKDSIKVDERRIRPSPGPKTYILVNKPRGFVTTVSDPEGRDTVLDLLPGKLRRGVKPVGRLDVQTEGLLLLTDDGDLARLVTDPATGCAKEYMVKVSGEPAEPKLEKLRRGGLRLDGRATRPCRIERAAGTARKGEEVDHRVRRSAERHDDRDRVLERVTGEDVTSQPSRAATVGTPVRSEMASASSRSTETSVASRTWVGVASSGTARAPPSRTVRRG